MAVQLIIYLHCVLLNTMSKYLHYIRNIKVRRLQMLFKSIQELHTIILKTVRGWVSGSLKTSEDSVKISSHCLP